MRPVLPTFYYLDHFEEMLRFVESAYANVLEQPHRDFMAQYRALGRDAQCLFVRMANRKGIVFPRHALVYAEVDDAAIALEALAACDMVRNLAATDYAAWLRILPKDDLLAMARQGGLESIRASWAKPALIAHLVEHLPFDTAAGIAGAHAYVVQPPCEALLFLLYLYFGKTFSDLKSFALRDLGVVAVNDAQSFSARFDDAAEARACFYYARMNDRLDAPLAPDIEAAFAALAGDAPAAPTEYAAALRARAVYRTGQFFERAKDVPRAIAAYHLAPSPESNERLVRLLYNAARQDEARLLLERMIDDPSSDEEHVFAADFHARKFGGQRCGALTQLLRKSQSMAIDELHRNAPEAGAAASLRQQGWQVAYTENRFWHMLFGLLFYEELFLSNSYTSGFDRLPHCLKDKSFATVFAEQITARLEAVRQGKGLVHILRIIAAHRGKPNGMVNWAYVDIDALKAFFEGAAPEAAAFIIGLMCRDFHAMRDGFPDLMLARGDTLKFVEIKAEGDVIRRNQLTRLRQLEQAGFAVEIMRVAYRYDPQQTYVVVDIETTGGRSSGNDRITEIGAVKMRGGKVVGEWHSLIYPQRPIPGFITALTGISNDMVRDAPVFADIAASFAAFMEDSIFVAHNVNFDYGFIAAEYRRLEQEFRYPKMCTCASMRRHYPGHRSYSLGVICAEYGVPLPEHHRALCDARAAAGLLVLVNAKREMPAAETA